MAWRRRLVVLSAVRGELRSEQAGDPDVAHGVQRDEEHAADQHQGMEGRGLRLPRSLDPGASGTNDPATSELMRRDTRRSADAVARVLGEQQRGETLRGSGAQLHVDGAVSGHRLRRRGTASGGDGAGVDYLEHDVRATRDDELAGLVEVEAAVVDEHLAAILGADRAAEVGVGSMAAGDGLAIRHGS